MRRCVLIATGLIAAGIALPGSAGGATLQPGDIVAASLEPTPAIVQIDPNTKAQTVIASGAPLQGPGQLTVTPSGRILVADFSAQAILSVNPADGSVSGVASSGFNPTGVDLTSDGRVIAASSPTGTPVPPPSKVVSVDLTTGAQTTIATLPSVSLAGVDATPSGRVYVAVPVPRSIGAIDLASGAFSTVSSCTCFNAPSSVASTPQGKLLVADGSGVFLVDPSTGAAGTLLSNSQLGGGLPFSAAPTVGGSVIMAVESTSFTSGAVFSFNPGTNALQQLTSGGPASEPTRATVVPPTCFGKFATIVGGPTKDKLSGTRFRDVIAAGRGDDQIKALGGNDLVCGGAGDDAVLGGSGADRLKGQSGADRLGGGKGKDRLLGGKGRDRLGRS